MRAYIDSDVLIWHLRGERQALQFLKTIRAAAGYELWIGAMQRAEIGFFMRDEEQEGTLAFLSQFSTASIDRRIVDDAARVFRQYNPSHGTDINDAILAATIGQTGGKLYCLNAKHYPMKDIVVERAWS